jgi:rare lipoprotein A
VLALALASCVSSSDVAPPGPAVPSLPAPSLPPVANGGGGFYKVGNPYQIEGNWYYPREQPNYDETGIASWYGAQFHGKQTANGEIFDKELMTAAHPTLPMPVHVRVTNLENGRSLIVRVNDRGPFKRGRLIDLSERAADVLGFRQAGTARVKVTFLERAPLNGRRANASVVAGNATRPPLPGSQPASLIRVAASFPEPDVSEVPVPVQSAIFVSAGAYVSIQNANSVVDRLRGVGAHLLPITRDGRAIYRVRMGPFASEAEAVQVLDRVTGLGHNGASIVVE